MNSPNRVSQWLINFYNFVQLDNRDILEFFKGKILFSPSTTKPDVIYAGLLLPGDGLATDEQKEIMWNLFQEFYRQNPV